ncbi:hypothetical protein B0A48_00953 [Cryoendolithus antarcticus]|uniref:Uncharacterized protein n=1 Tax=Cryoendolithus antarcticus TaxID=1507870 RepID=A0A1V8TRT5_9PEZI|nr:hypothetical protein B0A48_00953 [Cryoendolithus antarcticus]
MTTPSWALTPIRLPPLPSAAPLNALTFSSGTGSYLLTGSSDRSITLYNPAKKLKLQSYAAHAHPVLSLAISTDNSQFVSGGGDKTVFVWDVATAKTLRRFVGHSGRVEGVAWGGEGDSVVVSGSWDGGVRVWDLRSRGERAVAIFGKAGDAVSCVDVREGVILAGSVDGRVRGYDLRAGRVEEDCIGEGVTSVVSSGDGKSYLVGTLDSKLRLMDRKTGKCLQTFWDVGMICENYRIRSTLAMGDSLAVSGSENGQVLCWDVLTGELRYRLSHREGEPRAQSDAATTKHDVVSAVAWNTARKQLASAGGDGGVTIWDMAT